MWRETAGQQLGKLATLHKIRGHPRAQSCALCGDRVPVRQQGLMQDAQQLRSQLPLLRLAHQPQLLLGPQQQGDCKPHPALQMAAGCQACSIDAAPHLITGAQGRLVWQAALLMHSRHSAGGPCVRAWPCECSCKSSAAAFERPPAGSARALPSTSPADAPTALRLQPAGHAQACRSP